MLEARLLTDNPLTDNSPYWAIREKPLEQVIATERMMITMMMHDDIPKING